MLAFVTPVVADISMVSPWPEPPLSSLLRPCDRPIVVAGAGVSAGCGLPTGAQLAEWLRAGDFAVGVDFASLDAKGLGDHPGHVASRIFDADPSARGAALPAIAAHIDAAQARATFSRVVNAIAATPAGVVLTLNYDTLVEEAARAQGRVAHSLVLADVPELINDFLLEPDGELRVVHLHGITSDPGSLVIDHHSYMKQANNGEVRELLAALVANHNLCAIGTRFEEDYLGTVMLARRPSRPRHVIVCDLELAERVMNGGAGIEAERHNWRPCAYPVGEYGVLDGFCERLVTCDEAPPAAGPRISLEAEGFEDSYAPRQLIAGDEVDSESELSVEQQILFSSLSPHDEGVLAREQLAVVVGVPGSGKTRLLQELATDRSADRAIFLRLRDVEDVVGQPELLMRAWLAKASARGGEPVAAEDVVTGRVRAWFLLDGLDEVALDRRAATAEAVERLAQAFPQHRFTVSSRPVAALADLSTAWRAFDLVCDDEWRKEYLRANGVEEEWFWRQLGDPGLRLRSLLQVPFFLRGALQLLEAGEEVGGAMEISLELLDQSLRADEQLQALGDRVRGWLTRVALLQQLSGTVSVGEEVLKEVSEAEALGDPKVLTDLLAGRSLLARSAGRWVFSHRLFGEALACEYLLGRDPAEWLDCVAPAVDGWSAVLEHWSAPLRMVLGRSPDWRQRVTERDPRFVARATPVDAAAEERFAAARVLWNRAIELDVWLEPADRDGSATDSEVITDLIRAGGLDRFVEEVRAGLEAPSRFVRGNAIEVLAGVPVEDIEGVLRRVLDDDGDSVVRRIAAIAARKLGLAGLVEPIARRALSPADAIEAREMASAAIALLPPERKLPLATALLETGRELGDYLSMGDAPFADRVRWLELLARAEGERSITLGREVSRLVADLPAGVEGELEERIGYLVALSRSDEAALLDFVGSRPRAAHGALRAFEQDEVSRWEAQALIDVVSPEAMTATDLREGAIDALTSTRIQAERTAPSAEHDALSAPERSLAAALELPPPQQRQELEWLAINDRWIAGELTDEQRPILAEALSAWWGERDLKSAVRLEGHNATIENWATAVLTFAPVAGLELDEGRWLQVATCGWLFEPQREWLAAQATQARLESATEIAAGVRVLTDLLRVGIGFDAAPIRERLEAVGPAGADHFDLHMAGSALFAAEGVEGLQRLAAAGEAWREALRPQLAAAGVLEAQLEELESLARRLRTGELAARSELSWLSSVRDARALPALERLLVAIGEGATDEPTGIEHPVLRAIEASGGITAIALLDRLIREQPYPGAQFLVGDRDRALQSLLEPAASAAAQEIGDRLRLPVRAAAHTAAPPRLLGQFGQRLRAVLQGMTFNRPATAVAISLSPAAARGVAGLSARTPVRVEFGDEMSTVLGEDAQARALVGEGRVVLWLSGLAVVKPGATIHVTAIEPGGPPVGAATEVAASAGSVQLELVWDFERAPEELAVTVVDPP